MGKLTISVEDIQKTVVEQCGALYPNYLYVYTTNVGVEEISKRLLGNLLGSTTNVKTATLIFTKEGIHCIMMDHLSSKHDHLMEWKHISDFKVQEGKEIVFSWHYNGSYREFKLDLTIESIFTFNEENYTSLKQANFYQA